MNNGAGPSPISKRRIPSEDRPAVLTVDLDAVRANYRLLAKTAAGARCGAAVKADGYGMGMIAVSRALASEGCDCFFVENLDEGIALRAGLGGVAGKAVIYIVKGYYTAGPEAFLAHALCPVLVTAKQVARWLEVIAAHGPLPSIVKLNTGMNRLGLSEADARALAADNQALKTLAPDYLMSHLAFSEDPDHPMNSRQRLKFDELRALFPAMPATLAGSAGVMMGSEYHYDMVRPGVGLYGGNPFIGCPNPFAEVAHLKGKILQIREIDRGESVGYGATHRAPEPARIAIVGAGYGDGYGRGFDNQGFGVLNGIKLPVIGRVSMGSVAVDVSKSPVGSISVGDYLTLLGHGISLDDAAAASGRSAYELLTSLSQCPARRYLGQAESP